MRLTALLLALTGLLPLPAPAQAIFDEVPFVTTADHVTLEMLRVARVGPGDHVIDLGSGDGRIVVTAARQFGATGLGVEIVPELVERSQRAARAAGVQDRVRFAIQDLFATDLTPATVVTMYLLPEYNLRLRPALLALKPGTRVVSHDWDMGDWKPDHTSVLPVPDKPVGREKVSRIHLWVVPAPVAGLWCGAGPLSGFSLSLAQRYQEVTGQLVRRGRVREISARMDGDMLRTPDTRVGALVLRATGDQLQVVDGDGPLALAKGQGFRKAVGASCA